MWLVIWSQNLVPDNLFTLQQLVTSFAADMTQQLKALNVRLKSPEDDKTNILKAAAQDNSTTPKIPKKTRARTQTLEAQATPGQSQPDHIQCPHEISL